MEPTSTTEPTSAGRANALTAAAFVATAVASLSVIWRADGWPSGHDGVAFAQRTFIYGRHLRAMDLVPVWSSSDAAGFGSPMPLMYHKLFYLVAAPVSLITGTTRSADLLVLTGALVLGAYGMYALTRDLAAGRLAATAAGCSLIVANYTVTNWLVRGALAELTAAMLVPWLLRSFMRALSCGRMSTGLGVWLGLLWLSHSVLAFYAAVLLAVIYLLLAAAGRAPWSVVDPRTAWRPVTAFLLIVLPYLVPMLLIDRYYDLSRFHSWPLSPRYQFRSLRDYFWDTHWHFGRTSVGLTYQIDLAMLVLFVVGSMAIYRRRETARGVLGDVAPLILVVLVCLLLQRSSMDWFYTYVPGALYIQFPWRLLALLTPALIAAAFVMTDRTLPHDRRMMAIAGAAAWMIAGSGAFVAVVDPWLSVDPVRLTGNFSGFREYEPADAPPVAELQKRIAERWRNEGCSVTRHAEGDEVVVDRFNVECERAGVLPLPIYATEFHRVQVSAFDREQPCLDVPDIASVCGVTIPAGISTVSVHLPTLTGIFTNAWSRSRYSGR
jgi:hypothetical protein